MLEQLTFSQRTQVDFPATMLGGSSLTRTRAPGDLSVLASKGTRICTHITMHGHTHMIHNNLKNYQMYISLFLLYVGALPASMSVHLMCEVHMVTRGKLGLLNRSYSQL